MARISSGGTGDVTVTVAAGSTVTGVAGDAIDAANNDGGSGDVSVAMGANATITGGLHGIFALSNGSGSLLISTAAGDVVNVAAELSMRPTSPPRSRICRQYDRGRRLRQRQFWLDADGAGQSAARHIAAYNGDASNSGTPNANDFGDIIINNYANLTQTYNGVSADAGDGIAAFNYGIGNITVNDGTLNNLGVQGTGISAARFGIYAGNYLSGNTTVTMSAGDSIVSGSTGIFAQNYATSESLVRRIAQLR